ncbi:MAG: twin-arginine translocase TatA/TatE family subunit [Planctomycetota bacterium]
MIPLPLALFSLGPAEMIALAGLGLLLFGKRLPEVGRGVGQAIVQFKKGLKDVEDDVDDATKKAALTDDDKPKPALDG